jgi:hypothetical protein
MRQLESRMTTLGIRRPKREEALRDHAGMASSG